MKHQTIKRNLSIAFLLVALVIIAQIPLPSISQECKGSNLNLTVTDITGEITHLRCGYFGFNNRDSILCRTESDGSIEIPFYNLRRIDIIRNRGGRVILGSGPHGARPPILSVVELKNGDKRKLYILDLASIGGYSSWGKQTFILDMLCTVEFQ